jgi:flagellar hook-length control protein FliK
MDVMSKNSTSGMLSKELNSEPTLFRQPITLTNKLDTPSHSESLSAQKPSVFNQENNEKLFQTLNMLSRNWGNKLIDKIEKSIVDGIEQLEISLTPKSLGRLNVTINIHDTIAKINIVAESASAAALLGEAEQKLSQMMDASGLKLASLQTLTQQFGSNHKGKGQEHKLASTEKKSNIEEDLNLPQHDKNINSESEGLNLIA